MNLIQNISSTLKTWVFKKKLLKFSSRFVRDPQACFYCPEMCRFSCPVAETLRTNTVTPRGKMSLLHLSERGFAVERVTGDAEQRQWFLEQCSGCGRCTEFCVHEVDVASNLRSERAKYFNASDTDNELLGHLAALSGEVVLAEPESVEKLRAAGLQNVVAFALPYRNWQWGKLDAQQSRKIGNALARCSVIWVESPEAAWFLAKAVKEEQKAIKAQIRLLWQRYFTAMLELELGPSVVVHESFHLSRLLPRLGYSVPMYEKGFMPQHSGWNTIDCGGESFFVEAHPATAKDMGLRFLEDLAKDGRRIEKIVCQARGCMVHLRGLTNAKVTYWLDELEL